MAFCLSRAGPQPEQSAQAIREAVPCADCAACVRQREYVFAMFASYADKIARDSAPLDVAATEAIRDPCREDLRVSSIQAGTWSFDVPILFAMGDAWVDVQASLAAVPNGSCGCTTSPSSGPAGIHGTATEKPRGGRRR